MGSLRNVREGTLRKDSKGCAIKNAVDSIVKSFKKGRAGSGGGVEKRFSERADLSEQARWRKGQKTHFENLVLNYSRKKQLINAKAVAGASLEESTFSTQDDFKNGPLTPMNGSVGGFNFFKLMLCFFRFVKRAAGRDKRNEIAL